MYHTRMHNLWVLFLLEKNELCVAELHKFHVYQFFVRYISTSLHKSWIHNLWLTATRCKLALEEGLEPLTLWLTATHSSQLSYSSLLLGNSLICDLSLLSKGKMDLHSGCLFVNVTYAIGIYAILTRNYAISDRIFFWMYAQVIITILDYDSFHNAYLFCEGHFLICSCFPSNILYLSYGFEFQGQSLGREHSPEVWGHLPAGWWFCKPGIFSFFFGLYFICS